MADLAREQTRRGHEVTVLVTNESSRTVRSVEDGVRVIRAGRLAKLASTPLSPALLIEFARERADVIHLHFPYPLAEIAYLGFGKGRKAVLTYHGDIVRQKGLLAFYEPLLWRTLARVDRILATSAPYVESSRFLKPFRSKVDVVPLGIDADRFAHRDEAAVRALRARLAPRSEIVLISVGRLRYYKGLDVALRALAELADPNVRLVLVGTGPMEDSLRALANELSLGDRVLFAGEVSDADLPTWFQAADLYVSSASHRSEAFGISIVEAMACALPVVTTELGTGTSFVNRAGETGRVVAANDHRSLAAGIRDLVADAGLRARFGAAARSRVEREFTRDVMVDRVLDVYARVLRER
jgi:rhamnosyl/mannosyltransferase